MKNWTTKALALAIASGLGLGLATQAQAEVAQPWMIKVKASRLNMANKSEAIPALGVPENAIHVSDETIPEFDITYFWTPNWATELVLTIPQKHDVFIDNNGQTPLGTFKHLPPTLSMQYYFTPESTMSPYVSLGVNYTKIGSVKLNSPAGPLDLENDSIGLAIGAGVDYKLDNGWYLNFDVKKIQIRSDVYLASNGAKVSRVEVDPLLVGFGVGWKF